MGEAEGARAPGPRDGQPAPPDLGRDPHGLPVGTPAATPNTRRLVADYGGFEYDSDYYGDDLPFWLQVKKSNGELAPHLVVPYTLDCQRHALCAAQGFSHGDEFFSTCATAFDVLYAEGAEARR